MKYFTPQTIQVPQVLDISHDEMVFCLQKMYPDTHHGVHYMVMHPVEQGSAKRTGPAAIAAWGVGDTHAPDPDRDIAPIWERYKDEYTATVQARQARHQREVLLAAADVLVNRAHDSDNADALAIAKVYRQALRDVPQQAGFPNTIDWPTKPE